MRDAGRWQEGEAGSKCSSSAELQAGLWLSCRGGEGTEVLLEGWKSVFLVNSRDEAESGEYTRVPMRLRLSCGIPSHANPCRAWATEEQNLTGLRSGAGLRCRLPNTVCLNTTAKGCLGSEARCQPWKWPKVPSAHQHFSPQN